MNSGLSDVAKTQKAPTLKNVGAMSDNPIERTLVRAAVYGDNIVLLPQRTVFSIQNTSGVINPRVSGFVQAGYSEGWNGIPLGFDR